MVNTFPVLTTTGPTPVTATISADHVRTPFILLYSSLASWTSFGDSSSKVPQMSSLCFLTSLLWMPRFETKATEFVPTLACNQGLLLDLIL